MLNFTVFDRGYAGSTEVYFYNIRDASQMRYIVYNIGKKTLSIVSNYINDSRSVKFITQSLTSAQQLQARANIAAMANTPSGDPMHYMYEAAGAVYDAATDTWTYKTVGMPATGAPTPTQGPFTTEEVRYAYMYTFAQLYNIDVSLCCAYNNRIRFTFTPYGAMRQVDYAYRCFRSDAILEIAWLPSMSISDARGMFSSCPKLKEVAVGLTYSNAGLADMFAGCSSLANVYLFNLSNDIDLSASDNISNQSLIYTINFAQRSPTITLSPVAYARLSADTDVQAALAAKPNVTLADAGAAA